MVSLLSSLLLASGLRLFNPHEVPVDATVTCAGEPRMVSIGARDTVDLAECEGATLDAAQPLLALETHDDDGVETQRVLGTDAACDTFVVEAPLFGCKRGTATVAVPFTKGATYAWSVEGASVVSGHGTNRLVLTLGDGPSARVSATVTGACAATAVIGVRNPLVVEKLELPATVTANVAATIKWTYAPGSVPASQMLTGDAFEAPVPLSADARSYTFTPRFTGSKTIELRAGHAPTISIRPARRRRATGTSRAIADECPSARASARVDVRGCGTLNPSIDAPDSVEAGSTFTASIFLRSGETVKWTAMNGTILSGGTSDTVTVKAADAATEVRLDAGVAAGADCQASAEARIPISERAVCATTAPSAALAVESVSCNTATVRATFTGTPPFRGTWSDGTDFETTSTSLVHAFKSAATYTIRNFRDALCRGGVSQTARVTNFGPSVSVSTVGGTCPGAKAVATFSGKPPFTGTWTEGRGWFTTNATTLELPDLEAGTVGIEYFGDAECPQANKSSNLVEIQRRPLASLSSPYYYCTTSNGGRAVLYAYVSYGQPPFDIHWSDGVVTKGGEDQRRLWREVMVTSGAQEFTIEKVTSRGCDAELPGTRTARVEFRQGVAIDRQGSDIVHCLGEPAKVKLKNAVSPDAKIEWTITNAEILSGQGTPEVTYVQKQYPAAEISVKLTHPDELCSTSDRTETYLKGQGKTSFVSDTAIIKPGGTATLTVEIDYNIEYYSIAVFPKTRESDFDLLKGVCVGDTGRKCTYQFKDTHGAGQVALTLHAGGPCMEAESRSVYLAIEP